MPNDPWGMEIDKLVLWFGSHFTLEMLQCPSEEVPPLIPRAPGGNDNGSSVKSLLSYLF
jgi:hypothetical protein